jgi:uncharacterized damage-inducible protein DinB
MTAFLVRQLYFARSEFARCLDGISSEEGQQRIEQMNSISWIVGHLANHEHYLWVQAAQGLNLFPDLYKIAGYGQPASTPPLAEMLEVSAQVIASANQYLEKLTDDMMTEHIEFNGKPLLENIGSTLMRNSYHIWFHLGEVHAIRQQLGHQPPDYVGQFGEAEFSPGDLTAQ